MYRIARLLTLVLALITIGGTTAASAEIVAEGESRLIVFVGQEEGQEILAYCSGDELVMTIGIYPNGGASLGIAPEGFNCDMEMLLEMFPGATEETFDDPDNGWTVELADSETGQLQASRCDDQGYLITVTTGPMKQFTVEPRQPSTDCSGSAATL